MSSEQSIASARLGGHFEIAHWRGNELVAVDTGPNLVVDEGINYAIGAALNGQSQFSTFHIGVFKGNYVPSAGDSASNFADDATEATEYDEAQRPNWTTGTVSGGVLSNQGNEAQFTINADIMLYGAFIISDGSKGGTSGTLVAARQFGSPRDAKAGDVLQVRYVFEGTSS